MKSILRWGIGLAAFVCIATGVRADDVSSLKQELADVRAKIASMEASRMAPAASGDVASLTSMKKKGSIQIGGAVEIDILSKHRDDAINAQNSSSSDNVDSTSFATTDADLDFKIQASCDTFLKIKLDLDDAWNNTLDQDDLLEECYFKWNKVRGSAFSLLLGKAEVPYGQDKDVMITDSYHHNNGTGSYLGNATEAAGATAGNPHTAVGNFSHPGEKDNVFQITGCYAYKELAKVEVALFQNARGMHEDRSDDTLFFQSFASRITLTPIEGLKLMASVINEHFDSRDDSALYTTIPAGDLEDDQTAMSLAFDYNFKCIPLELFGEYQHGWNWNYNDDYSVDIAQIGAIYGVTQAIDLKTEFEWMGLDVNSNSINNRDDDEDYFKIAFAAQYSFDSGIYVMLEYCHEWYDNKRTGIDGNQEADVIGFRTAWTF